MPGGDIYWVGRVLVLDGFLRVMDFVVMFLEKMGLNVKKNV